MTSSLEIRNPRNEMSQVIEQEPPLIPIKKQSTEMTVNYSKAESKI